MLFTLLSASLLAANAAVNPIVLTRDSIGVENNNGKKLIIHEVAAKDTYYSIGRRYKVLPKTILDYNDNKFLQIGVIIKVPTELPFESTGPLKSGSEKTLSEVQTIEYIVQPKDNLHALSVKYGTTVEEIKKASNLNSINLSIGQIIKIPVKNTSPENSNTKGLGKLPTTQSPGMQPAPVQKTASQAAAEIKTVVSPQAKAPLTPKKADTSVAATSDTPAEEFVEHVVASNETMYSIASKHKMTVAQLMAKNKTTSSSLTVGQHLLIKGEWPPKEVFVPAEDNEPDSTEGIGSLKNPNLKYPSSRYGLNERDEKGTAVWIADQNMDATKMYVLHRTAPIGTVMKITNPMSNRTTFAKVVGKFTENESTKDVIVVMTKAVADSLGALDKRFFCNISYSGEEQHEQQ